MSCPICAHADRTGSWPQDLLNRGGTHCGFEDGCHRSWTSKVEAHCETCHQHFSTDTTADLHSPHCFPDPDVTRKRLVSARRKGGKPILALRTRRDGEVFVSWSAQDGDKPWGGEAA